MYTRSVGADIFENVCIQQENTTSERVPVIYSYSPESIKEIGMKDTSNWFSFERWRHKAVGKSLDDWDKDSANRFIQEETLIVSFLFKNPAHCLTDQVYSIAMDIETRGLERNHLGGVFYPHYVLPVRRKFFVECPAEDWCCSFLSKTGIIDPDQAISADKDDDSPVCFRKLVIPHMAAFRFPTNEMRMSGALSLIQEMAMNATNLNAVEWKEKEIPKDKPILLYDREGSGRRHLIDSKLIQRMIQEEYHAKVTLVGEKWNEVLNNMTAQAQVYNQFPNIIAPHGAHLTNLLFSRKGSRVIEISCWRPRLGEPSPKDMMVNITTKDTSKDFDEDWYGPVHEGTPMSWFYSFSRKLSVEHFLYPEYEGCFEEGKLHDYGSPKVIHVNATKFVLFAASRLGLKKRRIGIFG